MKRKLIFRISLVICFGFNSLMANAQQINTMYFMENMPVRHYLNPAFQTTSDFYFGLPAFGYTQLGLINNSISLKDLIYKQNGKSIYFLNKDGDKDKFYNALNKTTLFQTGLRLDLLDFGFRVQNSYWTFSLSEKVNGQLGLPKDLIKLALYGTPKLYDNAYNLQSLETDITAYTEAALGYSLKIDDKLTVGGKLKFLSGNFNASMKNTNLDVNAGADQWTMKGKSVINYSSPMAVKLGGSYDTISYSMPANATDWIRPSGIGGGIDFGFTYKPINELTVSAAVLDLGMIRWNKNVKNITNTIDYTFTGIGTLSINDTKLNMQILTDSILNKLTNSTTYTQTSNAYTTYTSPQLNVGAEYAFFENKLSAGLLSQTIKYNRSYSEELTVSVNGRPTDWFNMSASYSLMNGKTSNLGLGMSLRTGFVNWFLSANYLPTSYATYSIPLGSTAFNAPVPYNSKGVNFAVGINFVFGNRKDTDHDGVVDKKDQCPETPFSVVVDRKGCPLDSDGDGVPDYLDKCAKTPPAAYKKIDQNGCPVDNDSDGVADYLDKCPDTPKEAIGFVDSVGCTIDKDKDGVPDFKDKCPGTPIGTKVDSIGCPLDSDGDGVLDTKDKCPGTPAAARNMVDSVGCPLDKDMDGVPDYLDKCLDTPFEARKSVDQNGCTVENKIIKKVDNSSNRDKLLDSDGDGVPDSKDKCPNVPGPASNNGCPEIKKEVRNLFQKALQGIQFETGKSVIMPVSYKILNQIAGVLIANPTYIVEIRGHTDNAGNPASNMTLSVNRAKSVMKYLINKGVDSKRMTANGYGDTLPVVTNKTATGRALNRRVEFVVTFEEITFE